MVEQWGPVPLTYLSELALQNYTYGYIGNQDFTMYPILPPGSFIQVDESRNHVEDGSWRSEYERRIWPGGGSCRAMRLGEWPPTYLQQTSESVQHCGEVPL